MLKEIAILLITFFLSAFLIVTIACSGNLFFAKLGWFIFIPRNIGLIAISGFFSFIVFKFRIKKQGYKNEPSIRVTKNLIKFNLFFFFLYLIPNLLHFHEYIGSPRELEELIFFGPSYKSHLKEFILIFIFNLFAIVYLFFNFHKLRNKSFNSSTASTLNH